MKIYLADQDHNQQTLISDEYRVAVTNLAMYAREYLSQTNRIVSSRPVAPAG